MKFTMTAITEEDIFTYIEEHSQDSEVDFWRLKPKGGWKGLKYTYFKGNFYRALWKAHLHLSFVI